MRQITMIIIKITWHIELGNEASINQAIEQAIEQQKVTEIKRKVINIYFLRRDPEIPQVAILILINILVQQNF